MRILKLPISAYSNLVGITRKTLINRSVRFTQHISLSTDTANANTSPKSTELVEKYRLYCEIENSKNKHPDEIIKILEKAKNSKMDLSLSLNASLDGLEACLNSNKPAATELAFWIYDRVKSRNNSVTIQLYERMLKICSKRKMGSQAVKVFEDFREAKFEARNSIYVDLFIALASNGSDRASFENLQKYYKEYSDLSKSNNQRWRLVGPQLYFTIADAFCRNKHGAAALDVLMDMTEASHEPTARLCAPLLQTALFHHDTKVLRVLASWYANTFNERMEYGILNNLLQIAASHGDGQLALVAFQMLATSGHDASKHNYFCLVKSLLKSDDLISAIEALQEMEKRGYKIQSSRFGAFSEYQALKTLLVNSFLKPPKDSKMDANAYVDQMYYALVDQVKKGGQKVPKIVLDSIVEVSGRLDLIDRAFATFQEYFDVFQVQPDVDSYNSLLSSVAASKSCKMEQLLSIFQGLESTKENSSDKNSGPNSQSFTILLDAMIKLRDWRVLEDVLDHMSELSIYPEPRVLRVSAIILARRRRWKSVDKVLGLLKTMYGDNGVPQQVLDKINEIKNQQQQIVVVEEKV